MPLGSWMSRQSRVGWRNRIAPDSGSSRSCIHLIWALSLLEKFFGKLHGDWPRHGAFVARISRHDLDPSLAQDYIHGRSGCEGLAGLALAAARLVQAAAGGQPQSRLRLAFAPLGQQGFQDLAHQLEARLATESRFLIELLLQVVWKTKAYGTHATPQT